MATTKEGAAKRRRDRRWRMHWRHEQLTLQMALAAALHHSRDVGSVTYNGVRSQKTARAEATYDALRSQTTSVAGDTEFFSLYEEVRPRDRVQRRTVEQIVDTVLIVPSLDVPVPQMENQLVEVCRQLDTHVPEQVIEVPKISSTPPAEQLVEVPTIISYSSLRGIVEQNVDIPVPHGRGRGRGGLGLHPGQSSTAYLGADHRSGTAEQIIDIPAPRGGQDLPSAASSSGLPGTANQEVFSHFSPREKSAHLGSHSGSELLPESSPSTPAAQLARTTWYDEEREQAWCRFEDSFGLFYCNLFPTDHSQWEPPWERMP